MTVTEALEMLGEISDGYGPESEEAYDVLLELLTSVTEYMNEELSRRPCVFASPKFNRLRASLEGVVIS